MTRRTLLLSVTLRSRASVRRPIDRRLIDEPPTFSAFEDATFRILAGLERPLLWAGAAFLAYEYAQAVAAACLVIGAARVYRSTIRRR